MMGLIALPISCDDDAFLEEDLGMHFLQQHFIIMMLKQH